MNPNQPSDEAIAATVVDDAKQLIERGPVNQKTLLDFEEKWRRAGASPQTCKVARLLVSCYGASHESQNARFDATLNGMALGVRLAQDLFSTTDRVANHRLSTNSSASIGQDGAARPKTVVMIIHGIRTVAPWMDDVAHELTAAGFHAETLDYDVFGATQLAWPRSRRGKVDWLRREYERVCERNGDQVPSIVAHSFGTYLVANALRIYKLKFDRVVFCGAIVSRTYPWKSMVKAGLVKGVLNDYGKQDFWAWIVGWFVKDAGSSGYKGFRDVADGCVRQIAHKEFRHSDYFYKTNYRDNWLPFLRGERQPDLEPEPVEPRNWQFTAVTGGGAVALLSGATYLLYRYFWK